MSYCYIFLFDNLIHLSLIHRFIILNFQNKVVNSQKYNRYYWQVTLYLNGEGGS